MLSVFEDFENLNIADQRRYQIARRMGMVGAPSHLAFLNGGQQEKVNAYFSQFDTEEELEVFLTERLRRFV